MPDREYGGGSSNSGYGSAADVNPRAGDTPGFGRGGGGSVGGGGGYGSSGGLLSGGGAGGETSSRDAAIRATETANRMLGAARARAAAEQAFIASQPATGPRTRGGPASVAAEVARFNDMIRSFVSKTGIIESASNPFAKSSTSSATGLHQFTEGTWMDMMSKYRSDLTQNLSKSDILALRTDPELSTEMATNLAIENANYLQSKNIPINEKNLYLAHFLGAGDAAKVIKSDPDTPISDIVRERSINANQSILGGDKTASQINSWASNLMGKTPAMDFASVLTGTPAAASVALRGPLDAYQPTTGFSPPSGGQAIQPAQPAGLLDQLFGGPKALQDRIAALEAQGRTSTYPGMDAADVKQMYADEYTGGDVSKVQSRIFDFGQGEVVDYYAKDLPQKIGEAVGGLFGGLGNLFGGSSDKAIRGPNEAYGGSAIAPGSIFGNLFSGTPRADYGPYGNLTEEQYNKQYGGGGGSQLAARAIEAGKPTIAKVAENIPTPDLAKNPYLWQQYYNRIPQNYGIEMVQGPLVGPTIRGIFS